ncbi:ankyrin [Aaosphaeria arxii CBS 175.79]|uniref:Ankyrin n=1 Tax=Aaosphaeria arxii CBS 175.79 TaxID=1450172 RepID=A0A6A5XM89_9PLEO|nr:ankyrin [Aaosphaeria arxii CBS 175.79]KAF2014355.1 ankyrin [Aaosphaeria arxii CBS 175.79]
MANTLDLSAIPSSPTSPDWDVPKVEMRGRRHNIVRITTQTTTEIGAALKDLLSQFRELLKSGPSVEELQEFLRPWKMPASQTQIDPPQAQSDSTQIQPMVLKWLDHLGATVDVARLERFDLVAVLLDNGFEFHPDLAQCAAQIALRTGDPATLEFALDRGWDINQSFRSRREPILGSVITNEALVEWCLSHGADPNGTCFGGYTVMQHAAVYASLDTIKRLLQAGGNISPGSKAAGVAAHAAMRETDRIPIIEYLLSVGADINAQYLIQDENEEEEKGHCCDHFGKNKTALHVAIRKGDRELVEFLLERGADPTIKTKNMSTRFRWMDVVEFAEHEGHLHLVGLLQEAINSVGE